MARARPISSMSCLSGMVPAYCRSIRSMIAARGAWYRESSSAITAPTSMPSSRSEVGALAVALGAGAMFAGAPAAFATVVSPRARRERVRAPRRRRRLSVARGPARAAVGKGALKGFGHFESRQCVQGSAACKAAIKSRFGVTGGRVASFEWHLVWIRQLGIAVYWGRGLGIRTGRLPTA